MKQYFSGTRIVCGSGAMGALKDFEAQRLLLVTDPFFAENGVAERIARQAGAGQVDYFSDVRPDPDVALAAKGTALVREKNPDLIVALGGGSAMDCAKAMLYFSGSEAKLVAIPTTSGSGSEVTDFAILTHDKVKHPLVDERIAPYMAILDDELLTELPKKLIADAGFDVLTHAMEAYVGRNATPITDALAKEAFCAAFGALPASYGGRKDLRMKVHLASTMAGMAFTQAGLGLCHAMSHSLGGMFHVSHGRLNAVLLPAVIGCNGYAVGEKYAVLARAVGLSGSADSVALRNLKNALVRLRKELDLPETLAQAGIRPGEVWRSREAIAAAALADPCCATNPVKCETYLVNKVLEEVMGRE